MNDAAPPRPTALKIRHTMFRVSDLERSVAFYTGPLGMRLMRRRDSAVERCAYVGYGEESSNHALELIEARGPAGARVLGNCYGHIALGVPDLGSLCERLKQAGVTFKQELQTAPSGNLRLAFIADPDGFEIELTERA